jgi:hypothetical protein
MKKSMYLGPFQNKILFQNFVSKEWENKILFFLKFFSHPPLMIFQNSSALNKVYLEQEAQGPGAQLTVE